MALPGFAAQLGEEAAPEGTADESMLEQHLRAFWRAGNAGNFKRAAECFSAAMAEDAGAEPIEDDSYDEE